jgi:signal transduction histidine kinase
MGLNGRGQAADLTAPLRAKVLIVDDDERNAFAAVQALEGLGFELMVARSGDDALRLILQEEFAVILLDLHMPGMDGYETAGLIRNRRKTSRTPIIFLTAIFRDEAHVFQAYEAGAVDVVFKPVDPFILRSKVSVLVDIHMKTEEARRLAAHRQWLLEENARIQAEKSRAEKALRRSEAHQQAILRSLPVVFHARRAEPPFAPVFVSDSVEAITGFAPESFLEEAGFWPSRIHPEDLPRVIDSVSAATRTGAYACEFRWLCADGQYRYLMDQGVLAPGDEAGERQIFGVILDSTDRHLLEDQLAQARKMEAVGQLTGGVAHDFNNLLTVVLGNIDIMARRREEDEAKRAARIDAIRQAAERGRDLTHKLLAFSRIQKLSPVIVDIGDLVRNFAPLIRQAVGDAITVNLDLSPQALCARIDVTQLETALLNLAVNARDAMPAGGVLTISTFSGPMEAPNGARRDGVAIAVEDTGAGMDAEIRDRIFEPFFTTKEVGRGSGLGLSQIYGFMTQSEGQVRLVTAPGQGARFELLLPASAEPAVASMTRREPETMVGGSERILVVEDDKAVLALTVDLLRGLGYAVVTAPDAAEALARLRDDPSIDLLFSDVVMPGGVNGIELAHAAQAERPDLRILLTSGFIGDRSLLIDSDYPILDKPCAGPVLAARLRTLLDTAGPRRPPAKDARTAAKSMGSRVKGRTART